MITVLLCYTRDGKAEIKEYKTETRDFQVAFEEAIMQLGKDAMTVTTAHIWEFKEKEWKGNGSR